MLNSKVSIIVAIYKSADFLDKLITSLINQSYKNIEIILVDDGSPDKSGEICDNYASKDPRIKVIHKINGGACEARNVGMENASGDYIVIVDGDDWLETDFVEYMMMLIEKTDSDMAFSDKIFTTRDRVQTVNDKVEKWTAEEAAAAIIYPHMDIGPWNKIYKTTLLRENNITFSVPWSGEGLYFASMAAQHAKSVGVGHRKVYNYRLNNVNSGLTKYNIQMGINALENIKYIGENLFLRTERMENAVKWHIWKNNNFLLFLIIATNSQNENKQMYKSCKTYIRKYLLPIVIKSEISYKKKIRMILQGCFPVLFAKRQIRKNSKGLKKDLMK